MAKVFANNPYEGLTVIDAMSHKQAPAITGGVQAPQLPSELYMPTPQAGMNFGSMATGIANAAPGLIDMGQDFFGKAPDIELANQPSLSDGSLFSMAANRENKARINAAEGLSAGGVLGSAGKGATTGASIGSVIPGVGTAIGAGVGALVGAVGGWVGGRKKKKKKEEAKKKAQEKARSYTQSFNQRVASDAMEDSTQDRINALKSKYAIQPSFRSLI